MADASREGLSTSLNSGSIAARVDSGPAKRQRKQRSIFKQKVLIAVTALLGVVIVATSLVSGPALVYLVRQQVDQKLTLADPDGSTFKLWANPGSEGVPTYMSVLLWNLTNPDDVLAGADPKMARVGPFTYEERMLKHSFRYNADKSVIYYKINRTFHFVNAPCPAGTDPSNFALHCSIPADTLVTTVNVPLLGVIGKLNPLRGLEETVLNFINKSCSDPSKETVVIRRNVQDIVYGYDDPILHELKQLLKDINSSVTLPDYRILENNSFDGRTKWSAVHTRAADGRMGEFEAWYGNNKTLNIWNGCSEKGEGGGFGRQWNVAGNMLNGTEGFFFQPPLQKDRPLYAITPDLSRGSALVFNDTVTWRGISLYRYIIDPAALLNISRSPPNCAFGAFGLSGTLNLSAFVGGVPIFASKPYFLDGDPKLAANLSGYAPPGGHIDRMVYDTYLDVEPITGGLFRANKALQSQLQVVPSGYVKAVSKLKGFLLPITINVENVRMPTNITDEFKDKVQAAYTVGNYVESIGPFVGCAFLAVSLYLVFTLRRKLRDDQADPAGCDEASPLLGAGTDDGPRASLTPPTAQ